MTHPIQKSFGPGADAGPLAPLRRRAILFVPLIEIILLFGLIALFGAL